MAVRVGILGAAGYTGGELIRLLINHPEAQIVFANSESNAGNLVADVHEGLYGDTDLRFTAEMPFEEVDVVFFCFGMFCVTFAFMYSRNRRYPGSSSESFSSLMQKVN